MEIDRIPRNADGDVGIQFRMLHGSHEFRAVEHIYVEMVRPLPEISVQQIAQIFRALLAVLPSAEGTMEKVLEIPSRHVS